MKISNFCKSYFTGFQELSNYKKNNVETTALAVLKIFSYFTLIVPLAFAAVYGTTALYRRISKKETTIVSEQNVHKNANEVFKSRASRRELPRFEFSEVLKTYNPTFAPCANLGNLQQYSLSKEFQNHAKTARIYYNSTELNQDDALKIIFQREPTNIAMGPSQYNEQKLEQLFGYKKSIYIDGETKKSDGSLFRELPNTVAVYSETYLWDPPGGINKKEVACLSLPAPALDSLNQPHYEYYMNNRKLDEKKYDLEMKFLFKIVEKAVRENKEKAFGGRQIKRLVLSKFGQGAFLGALSPNDQQVAQNSYKKQLKEFLERIKNTGLEVVMSEYSHPGKDVWHEKMIVGDIVKTSKDGDLIINAWDPHSAPGNGNDADASFDGAMGKSSGILLTQTSWLNKVLREKESLVPVK